MSETIKGHRIREHIAVANILVFSVFGVYTVGRLACEWAREAVIWADEQLEEPTKD